MPCSCLSIDRHINSPHGVNHSTVHPIEKERIKARLWQKTKSHRGVRIPLRCLPGRHIRLSPKLGGALFY